MEIWKDAVGYEGLYEISSFGRVKTLEKILPHNKFKHITCVFKEKIMKISLDTKGYPSIVLRKNGIPKTLRVHRLMTEAFIPNPENKAYVNHINGIKHDNMLENLEWSTPSENESHAYRTKLKNSNSILGVKHFKAKLTEKDILEIREKFGNKTHTAKELAEEYGIGKRNIWYIHNRQLWNHVL